MVSAGETDERILAKVNKTVLGYVWHAPNDVITFTLSVDIASKKNKARGVTKYITRDNVDNLQSIVITNWLVLSFLSSWYNPIGVLSPISFKNNIKLSIIIKDKYLKWDDDLDQELPQLWRELFTKIVNLF